MSKDRRIRFFARGEEKEGGDIDVLIELEDRYETFDNFMD